ncbi:hypothetical protein OAC66_00890 [Cyclobacteriaceae bacterium]|jgi:hypothetical protein|nr:hypothetical protein [Cyclobacteriaceae bacterium]|tara:strand:- start:24 stop:1103 length:1080 start_codon:yes stop_codon:yes gene_type:complete
MMKKIFISTRFLIGLITFFGSVVMLSAQSRMDRAIQSSLFQEDEILELTLTMDIETVTKDIEDREEHAGTLVYKGADGTDVSLSVMLKTRGKTRANPEVCKFPPLQLNFKKKGNYDNIFTGQDKLKLVAHCQYNKGFDDYVAQEYLTYKHYNILTDNSFRVRLLRVTYVDTGGNRDPFTKYAFLIEEDEILAERRGKIVSEKSVRNQDMCEHNALDLMILFEFMIGNTDWGVGAKHNMKLIADDSTNRLPIPVPYDFDYAGAIMTTYAQPAEALQITSVRQRLFRGLCRQPGSYEKIFQIYNDKKDDIYALYQNSSHVDDKFKKSTLKYFDQFYGIINDPKKAKRQVLEVCRAKHNHVF